jgi:hypothetical protein
MLGQELRRRAADAARRAGDDRGLSIEDSHLVLLFGDLVRGRLFHQTSGR